MEKKSWREAISLRAKKHSSLTTVVLALPGLAPSLLALEGIQRVVSVAITMTAIASLYIVLTDGSVRKFFVIWGASLLLPISMFLYWLLSSEALVLETFRPDRGHGFVEISNPPHTFEQEADSRLLKLNVGMRSATKETVYLKKIDFTVVDFVGEATPRPTGEMLSYKITLVFDGPPLVEEIQRLEKQLGMRKTNQSSNVIEFRCDTGLSDKQLILIKRYPTIKSATFTKLGEGQSQVDFVAQRVSPELGRKGDRASCDLEIDVKENGTGGIRAEMQFSRIGTYSLRGEIHYGSNKTLNLPDCRVVITR